MIVFFLFYPGMASETFNYSKYSDPGSCICDLTLNSCDDSCCCDPDCSSNVTWPVCEMSRFSTFGQSFCVDSREVFKVNSRRGLDMKAGSSDQTCVLVDNEAKIKGFHDIVTTVDSATVNTRVSASVTYSSSLTSLILPKTGSYKEGDLLTEFSLFLPDLNGNCIKSGVSFLHNFQGSCVLTGKLEDVCKSLSASSSIGSSYVYQNANGVQSAGSAASPSYQSGTCFNAIVQSSYTVNVTNNADVSVSNMRVQYVITDITGSDVSVYIKNSVFFYTSTSATPRSGNPGYQVGLPLVTNSSSSLLLMSGKSPSGSCDSTSNTGSSVRFGNNFIMTCSQSLTYTSLKTYCSSSPDIKKVSIFQPLLSVQSLGKWGVSSTLNSDDWISITSSEPNPTSFAGTDCNISSSLVLNVYYAPLGPFTNPQFKVLYVERYFLQNIWKFAGSRPESPQNFLFSASVNFVPYNDEYNPYFSKPRKDLIMPQDVLDPVRTSYSKFFGLIWLYFLS